MNFKSMFNQIPLPRKDSEPYPPPSQLDLHCILYIARVIIPQVHLICLLYYPTIQFRNKTSYIIEWSFCTIFQRPQDLLERHKMQHFQGCLQKRIKTINEIQLGFKIPINTKLLDIFLTGNGDKHPMYPQQPKFLTKPTRNAPSLLLPNVIQGFKLHSS